MDCLVGIWYPRMGLQSHRRISLHFGGLTIGIEVHYDFKLLILAPETNMEDAQLTLHFFNRQTLNNTLSLLEIARASQINDAATFAEGHNRQINDTFRRQQIILFEEKVAQMVEQYQTADSAVQGKIYDEINHGFEMIEREKRRLEEVQDPPEMRGRCTFGKGGKRRRTAAELTIARLEKNDKPIRSETQSTSSSASVIPIVDLTNASTTPKHNTSHSTPVVLT